MIQLHEWRIRSVKEKDEYDGSPLYWNKEHNAWSLSQFATLFSETEQATYRVPEGGLWEWAAWAKLPDEVWSN